MNDDYDEVVCTAYRRKVILTEETEKEEKESL